MGATKRILIVDDERLTRLSLADFLQESGYETATAADADTALAQQQEHPFDVCIVDIRMPGLDGTEIILRLYRLATHSIFIVYTGSPQFTLPSTLEKLGVSERQIVRKPVGDMNIFITLIEEMTQIL
jgi:two-component system OmpR family response regulator